MTTVMRPGVFSRVLWTPEGFVWLSALPDRRTLEAARLTGEVLWSVTAADPWGHLDAAAAPDGSIVAVAQSHRDTLLRFNRTGWLDTGLECSGIQSAGVAWNGSAFVLFSKRSHLHPTYWRQEIGRQAVEVRKPDDMLGTADGWFSVRAGAAGDGSEDVLSWADRDRFWPAPDGGVGLMESTEVGSFRGGQEWSTADRIIGRYADGRRVVIHEGLGKYPRFAIAPDGTIAATWANLGGTVSVALSPFPAWTPPIVVAPPVNLDSLPVLNRPLWLGVEYAFADEGNCSWGYKAGQTGSRPVLEGVEPIDRSDPSKGTWLDTVPAGHPLLAIWDSVKDNPQYSAEARLTAEDRGVQRLRYWDGSPYQDATGTYVAGVCVYPNMPTEQLEIDLKRIAGQGKRIVLIWAAYTAAGWWSKAQVRDALVRAVEFANAHPAIVGLIGFGRIRPGEWWPKDEWKHLVATMPAGELPALEAPAVPLPGRPDQPPALPREDGTNGNVPEWAAIGAGIAAAIKYRKAIGRVLAWPFRKLFGK